MTTSSLLTPDLIDRLRANSRSPDVDHVPEVKLFNPAGAGTWLVTELADDGDTMFGLADLDMGCPELGSFSLVELTSIRLPFGLSIERDRSFSTTLPLSTWAEAARSSASIAAAERILATIPRRERN